MAIVAAGLRLGEPQQLDGRWPAEWAVRYCDFRSLLAEDVNISSFVEVNSIVFGSDSDSFTFNILRYPGAREAN